MRKLLHTQDRQRIYLMIIIFIGLILIIVPWLLELIKDGMFLGQPLHSAESASYQIDIMTKMIPAIGMEIIQDALEDQGLNDESASQYLTFVMVPLSTPTLNTSGLTPVTPSLFRMTPTLDENGDLVTATNDSLPSKTSTPSNTPWWPGGGWRTRVLPTSTLTHGPTQTPTSTHTATLTATQTFTLTATFTLTLTRTSTPTPSPSSSSTMTFSPSLTPTASETLMPSSTLTNTPTEFITSSPTSTFTVEPTNTPVMTPTDISTATLMPSLTHTLEVKRAISVDSIEKEPVSEEQLEFKILDWFEAVRERFSWVNFWPGRKR